MSSFFSLPVVSLMTTTGDVKNDVLFVVTGAWVVVVVVVVEVVVVGMIRLPLASSNITSFLPYSQASAKI